MTDEQIKERFEELQGQLDAYKKLFDSLKDDVTLLIQNSPQAQGQIISYSIQTNNPRFPETERYKAFIQKYGLRIGG